MNKLADFGVQNALWVCFCLVPNKRELIVSFKLLIKKKNMSLLEALKVGQLVK